MTAVPGCQLLAGRCWPAVGRPTSALSVTRKPLAPCPHMLQRSSTARSTLRLRARAPTQSHARPLSVASGGFTVGRSQAVAKHIAVAVCAVAWSLGVKHTRRGRPAGQLPPHGTARIDRGSTATAHSRRANSTRVDCATTECACLTECPGGSPGHSCLRRLVPVHLPRLLCCDRAPYDWVPVAVVCASFNRVPPAVLFDWFPWLSPPANLSRTCVLQTCKAS